MTDRSGDARQCVFQKVRELGAAIEAEGFDPDDFATCLMAYVAHMAIETGTTDQQMLGNFKMIIEHVREHLDAGHA